MRKARIYISLAISLIGLSLSFYDLLKVSSKPKSKSVRNPKGNVDSLAKAREAKAKKNMESNEYSDLEKLQNAG